MKPKSYLSLILVSGFLGIPHVGFSRDEADHNNRWAYFDSDVRQLQGRWYMNGDPNKPTEININGRRLEARNENGQISKLELGRGGNIRAVDWHGVRGVIRGNRIEWDNGATWTRRSSGSLGSWSGRWNDRNVGQLQGRWYFNGDANKPTEINVYGRRVEAKNENGKISRLEVDREGNIWASDWQNLRGDVRGDRIEWANGTRWTRSAFERFGER